MIKKSVAIGIFAAMAAVIIGVGAYAWTLDSRLEGKSAAADAYSSGAMGEFTGAMASFDEALRESRYATNSAIASTLCAKAAANAASAVTALASLPYSTQELEVLAQYINGAGDYALYLANECAEGRTLTAAESGALEQLSAAVSGISAETGAIFAALDSGDLTMDEYGASGEENLTGTVGSELAALDAALDAFPELDYAGRYSAASVKPEAAYLNSLEPVSEGEARTAAAEFLGVDESELEAAGRSEGAFAAYGFTHEMNGDTRYISVAENGGVVVSLSGACSGGAARVSAEAAVEAALEKLAALSDETFVPVLTTERAGVYDITFVPEIDGVLLMPDAVDVSVDAATGEVCSYSARGYVMYHAPRTGLAPELDADAARAAVPDSLTVEGERLALTRSDGGEEALCWKFACKNAAGEGVNVFVDAKTGLQVKIELTN